MRDTPSFGSPRLGLFLLIAGVAAPVAGCLVSGNSGDPGAGFLAGTAGATGTGYAGAYGTGYAGAPPPRSDGGTARSDGGTPRSDGGTTRSDGGAAGSGATDGGGAAACSVKATATFEFTWTLEDASGAATTCAAAGGQTVDITVVRSSTKARADFTVPCSAPKATTCAMPADDYSVTFTLRNAGGTGLSEIVAPLLILEDGQVTDPGALPFQVGGGGTTGRGFAATWTIDDANSGELLNCAQAGATTVRLVAGAKTFDLPCAPGKGRTTAVAPGDYPVMLRLLDAQGDDLSVTQTMTLHVGAGQLVFLGDVLFDVI
jgi:hypothetical protein